jgi:chaperonin cofactor prefoldin
MILQSLPSDISELVVTKQQAETALKEAGIVLRAVLDS